MITLWQACIVNAIATKGTVDAIAPRGDPLTLFPQETPLPPSCHREEGHQFSCETGIVKVSKNEKMKKGEFLMGTRGAQGGRQMQFAL